MYLFRYRRQGATLRGASAQCLHDQILSPRPIISSWIRFGIAWSGFGLRLAATVPRTTGDQAAISPGSTQQCRLRVWPGTPLLPISSVRGFARRKVATGRDLISL